MKCFVYAKIGIYLYWQSFSPYFSYDGLNFDSFLPALKKDLQKSGEFPIFVFINKNKLKTRYHAKQPEN